MKISVLLEREDFGAVLQETLSHYLSATTGTSYLVNWYARNPGTRAIQRKGLQPWLCNSLLDAVFAPQPARAAIMSIRNAYGKSDSAWRTLAYSAYVTLATRSPGRGLLAQHAMGLTPPVPNAPWWVMRGGANRIRLLDFYHEKVHVLMKAGLPGNRMRSEIAVRCRLPEGIRIPRVISVADDSCSYTEELIDGISIDQIGSGRERDHARSIVYEYLVRLSQASLEYVPLHTYLSTLGTDTERLLSRNRVLAPTKRRGLQGVVDGLTRGVRDSVNGLSPLVPVALSHGDLQDGNILSDGQDVWLIDWELAGRRLWLYDCLLLTLRGRQTSGIGDRLRLWVRRSLPVAPQVDMAQALAQLNKQPDLLTPHILGRLFLLEEIRYQLEMDDNRLLIHAGRAFDQLPRECETLMDMED